MDRWRGELALMFDNYAVIVERRTMAEGEGIREEVVLGEEDNGKWHDMRRMKTVEAG